MAKAKEAEAEDATFGEEGVGVEAGEGGLVVDLSGVNENQGQELLPKGIHACYVDDVTFGESQRSGNPMWTWIFRVDGGEYAETALYFHTTFTEKGLPRLKKVLARVAPELLDGPFNPEEVATMGVLNGKKCRVRIDHRLYEKEMRNNVRDVLPPGDAEGGDAFLGG